MQHYQPYKKDHRCTTKCVHRDKTKVTTLRFRSWTLGEGIQVHKLLGNHNTNWYVYHKEAAGHGRNNKEREAIQKELKIGASFAELRDEVESDLRDSFGESTMTFWRFAKKPRRQLMARLAELPKRAPVDAFAEAVLVTCGRRTPPHSERRPQQSYSPYDQINISCTWSDYSRITQGMRPH